MTEKDCKIQVVKMFELLLIPYSDTTLECWTQAIMALPEADMTKVFEKVCKHDGKFNWGVFIEYRNEYAKTIY